jgi:hypothetical protein
MRAHTLVGERFFVFMVCKYAWYNSGLVSASPETLTPGYTIRSPEKIGIGKLKLDTSLIQMSNGS